MRTSILRTRDCRKARHRRLSTCGWIALGLLLGGLARASTDPVVYHSPDDDGARPASVPAIDGGGAVSTVHLYMDEASGSATPSSAAPCEAGEGNERCGWALALVGADGLEIVDFRPEGDVVFELGSGPLPRIRLNGGRLDAGELGPVKLGDLDVRALTGVGTGRLESGGVLDARLDPVALPPQPLFYAPEPGLASALLPGLLLLARLMGGRRRRSREVCQRGTPAVARRRRSQRPLARTVPILVGGLVLACGMAPHTASAAGCGDIDGDDAITLADVTRLRAFLADPVGSALAPEELARCQVTAKSNTCDLAQLGPIWHAALIPEFEPNLAQLCEGGDADADGTPAIEDRCPSNPFDEAALFGGCGPVGLFARADRFADDTVAEIEETRGLLAGILEGPGSPSKATLLAQLDAAEAATRSVAALASEQADCDVVPMAATDAERSLATSVAIAQGLLLSIADPTSADDWTEGDQEALELSAARGVLERAHLRSDGLAQAYGAACAAPSRILGSGIVADWDDALRLLELEDGSRFWVPTDAALAGDLSIGASVSYGGNALTSDAWILTDVSGANSSIFASDPECVFLRFAPVQPFYGSEPLVLHEPDGYRATTGTYLVEAGFRLAAIEQDCPRQEVGLQFRRQYIEVIADYTSKQTGAPASRIVASDLREVDAPVPLPTHEMDLGDPVQLTAKTWAKTCQIQIAPGGGLTQSCSDLGLIASRIYSLDVNPMGGRCFATYADALFDVDDQQPSDFRTTHVAAATVLGTWDAGAPPIFRAEAYALCGNAPCASPGPIAGTQSFAIRNDDFVPIHRPIGGFFKGFYPLFHGVSEAAGVRWPHVTGQNGGLPFRYSCGVTDITRDVVDFCPSDPASFFHLPFVFDAADQADDASWSVGQGNMCANKGYDCPTHDDGYAIDMGRGVCGEPIRAPRAGRIARVRIGDCQNGGRCACPPSDPNCAKPSDVLCDSFCCDMNSPEVRGNAIWLRHQDDTYTTYSHLRPGSIAVAEGDLVRRGQILGQMGTTGNSAGIHLHWETKKPQTGPLDTGELVSELGLFQNETAKVQGSSTTVTCHEPDVGSQLRSNNVPWP